MAQLIGLIFFLLVFVGMCVGLSGLVAIPVWFAWNHAVVPMFRAPGATFLQAWGLMFLVWTVGSAVRRASK